MEEPELRDLTAELRADLPRIVADETERASVDAALRRALDLPSGAAKPALRAALAAHAETRKWLRHRLPADTERAIILPGDPTAPLGVLFMCPHEDYDYVRETVSEQVPLCPEHHVALIRVEG
jgi:Arc/MetJ family transcription regulator